MDEPAAAIAAAPASPRRPSGMWSWILLIVFTFFIVYPLSIGPVFALLRKNTNNDIPAAFEIFYSPVLYACEVSPVVNDLMTKYVKLWGWDD